MNQSIKELLEQSKNIAIIGCSGKPERTSCKIARYLQDQGYNIIPIHPDYEEIHGEKVYPTVYDVPEEIEIDIVDIFRNSKYTADMVDDIIKRVEITGRKPVVWTQLGVSSKEAKKKAEQAGLPYIENRCIMVDHREMVA
ncbi:MAG: CoA-binding protein [Balneolaceae bacterium]|nr:CoA-binding protein [Balneolaceae bacterium]